VDTIGHLMVFLHDLFVWLTNPAHWQGSDGIPLRTFEHLWYSLFAAITAVAIALPIGLLVGHTNKGSEVAVNMSNLGRAIPSFGIIVLAWTLAGFGYIPVWVALTALGLPPIVTNSYVGIRSLDPEVREAAEGMGMTGAQVLFRVEAPIAMPLIMAGIRTSVVQIVATTTIAAFITLGGLGRYIFDGLPQRQHEKVVAGAILVALLSLAVEYGLGRLQDAVVPRGLRRRAATAALEAKMSTGRPGLRMERKQGS
jgi:osmoprotectant transport system permease protein